MSDHLRDATPQLRARLEELGGAALIEALAELVEAEEEEICAWFDRQDENHAADEVSEWSIVSAEERENRTLFVELGVDVVVYSTDDGSQEGIWHTTLPAYVTVRRGPPLCAENLDLDAADADLQARVAARLPTVYVRMTERGLEVHGLPGPERHAADAAADAAFPSEACIPHPVSDSADDLGGEAPTYAEDPSDRPRPPNDGRHR